MKKILIPLLLVVLLALAACGSSSTAADQSTTTDTTTTGTGNLSTEMELIVGTFKLEGTENAVTSDEAADLLPLWQAYATLSQSDITAQTELDALIAQIKDTMGPTQVDAITVMKLTQDDAFAFMQDNGITMGGRNAADASGTPVAGQDRSGFTPGTGPGQGNVPSGSAPQDAPPSGSMPQGADPGSDMGQGGTTLDPAVQATMQASGSQPARRVSRVPVALVEALIELLKSK
jgi:hypothetical protein